MAHFEIELIRSTPSAKGKPYLAHLVHRGRAPSTPSMGGERLAVLSVDAPQLGEALAYALYKHAMAAGLIDSDNPATDAASQ